MLPSPGAALFARVPSEAGMGHEATALMATVFILVVPRLRRRPRRRVSYGPGFTGGSPAASAEAER